MTKRNDLSIYESHANRWWDRDDRFFRSLRSVGAFHVELVRREWRDALVGARLVELGCGGGFVSLELAAAGANVTGVDLSPSAVRAAREEAARRNVSAEFVCADLYRAPLANGSCDFAVLSDVLEHVEDQAGALAEASRVLRDGGRLFLSTFDRTRASAFTVVHLAEGVGLVPRGTHDPRLFIRPGELAAIAADADLEVTRIVRERPAFLRTILTWTVHLREATRGHGISAFFVKRARGATV